MTKEEQYKRRNDPELDLETFNNRCMIYPEEEEMMREEQEEREKQEKSFK